MREIKFRTWDKRSKELIQIQGFKYVGEKHIQLFYLDTDGCSTTCTCEKEFIVLMQYIGLKDKNGTEIYEGDIVRFDEEISVVRYDEETARFVLEDYGIRGCLMEYGWDEGAGGFGIVDTNGFDDFNDISEIEIIGNIYENPELLEGRE